MNNPVFEVTDDQELIKEKLESEEPLLCYVLNEKLSEKQIDLYREDHYVVEIERDDKNIFGIICGLYKKKLPTVLETEKLLDTYTRLEVLDKLITEPQLCCLLNEALDETVVSKLGESCAILEINYENQNRNAIDCAYYTAENIGRI